MGVQDNPPERLRELSGIDADAGEVELLWLEEAAPFGESDYDRVVEFFRRKKWLSDSLI